MAIGSLSQKANIDGLFLESLWCLFVDETDVGSHFDRRRGQPILGTNNLFLSVFDKSYIWGYHKLTGSPTALSSKRSFGNAFALSCNSLPKGGRRDITPSRR